MPPSQSIRNVMSSQSNLAAPSLKYSQVVENYLLFRSPLLIKIFLMHVFLKQANQTTTAKK